jgi:EAL domain-containing protein (putative c-di-GMP-specific phosphodiesterase class I)
VLEITEGSLMERGPTAPAVLRELQQLGVGIVLDDFGTGWSSLSRLRHLPITGLKVDRSFVAELETGEGTSGLIVAGIVQMSHALGLGSVAEGIETRAQADRLRELGCRSAQGFLFARPMDAEATGRLLAASAAPAAGLPL